MAAHANEEKICCALCFLDARHAKRLKVCLAYKRMGVVGRGAGGGGQPEACRASQWDNGLLSADQWACHGR